MEEPTQSSVDGDATAPLLAVADTETVVPTEKATDAQPLRDDRDQLNGAAQRDAPHDKTRDQHGHVYELLEQAANRQRAFEATRVGSLEIGLRDDRKWDYPLHPAPRARSARSASRRRSSLDTHTQSDPEQAAIDAAVPNSASSMKQLTWRDYLEVHAVQLLRELRFQPQELRVLLSAHYPNRVAEDSDADSSSEDEAEASQVYRLSRASDRELSPLQLKKRAKRCISVKEVYQRLSQIIHDLGEAIYTQIRGVMVRSTNNGVFDRESNKVRLDSLFKLELRRQVTIDQVKQVVLRNQTAHAKNRRLRRAQAKAEARRNEARAQGVRTTHSHLLQAPHDRKTAPASAHEYKMLALERLLQHSRRLNLDADCNELFLPHSETSVNEKITTILYSRNRDYFPFWKEPPESLLSREETSVLLRKVIAVLSSIVLFGGMSIEQLIDIARAAQWRIGLRGDTVFAQGSAMDRLVIAIDGTLASSDSPGRGVREGEGGSTRTTEGQERASYGDIGMVATNAIWSCTVQVSSARAKMLCLTREAFDCVLLKLFGGYKRQASTKDAVISGKRPSSSPALVRRQSKLSQNRPSTSRSEAIANYRAFREEYLSRVSESTSNQTPVTESKDLNQLPGIETTTIDRRRTQGSLRSGTMYQHYPTFSSSGSGGAGSHTFRLKCTQPIAFGMKAVEDVIQEEWAPPFPDIPNLVDYLSTADSGFLFEKCNLLFRTNLRMVCSNLPFQEKSSTTMHVVEVDSIFQESQAEASDLGGPSGNQSSLTQSGGTVPGSVLEPGTTGPPPMSEGEPMTFGQFAEARRRMFGHQATSFSGVSPSMINVMSSATTSATLAKNGHAPFASSSFVPETSFTDDLWLKAHSEEDDEEHVPQAPPRRSSTVFFGQQPEVDDDNITDQSSQAPSESSTLDVDLPPRPTQARKMAVDSIVNSITGSSPTKKKSMEHEAARRIILQKHLCEANEEPTPTANNRRRSTVVPEEGTTAVATSSHAPLPLRADLQRRMEVVLAGLKMKPKAKLDLVLKYTHADYYDLFPDAVVLWEQALHYIQKREKTLDALRQFELVASDPRRHFRSLSTYRLTEQKERDALFYQLNYATDLCRESQDDLEKRCQDIVYFAGQPYREKMKKDYTELLYEVEQERLRIIYKGVRPFEPKKADQDQQVSGDNGTRSSLARAALVTAPTPGRSAMDMDAVSGSTTLHDSTRYTLSTPRESIYKTVTEQRREDDEEEKRQAQRQSSRSAVSRVRGLAAQVKRHRQAQLEAARTPRLPPPSTPRREVQVRPAAKVETDTKPQSGGLSGLKTALESALGW